MKRIDLKILVPDNEYCETEKWHCQMCVKSKYGMFCMAFKKQLQDMQWNNDRGFIALKCDECLKSGN